MLTVESQEHWKGQMEITALLGKGNKSFNDHRIKSFFPQRLNLAVGADNWFFSTFFDQLSFSEAVSFIKNCS